MSETKNTCQVDVNTDIVRVGSGEKFGVVSSASSPHVMLGHTRDMFDTRDELLLEPDEARTLGFSLLQAAELIDPEGGVELAGGKVRWATNLLEEFGEGSEHEDFEAP